MLYFYELIKAVQQAKNEGHPKFSLCCANFWVYEGKPLQFNVTMAWHSFPMIKFEERASGRKIAVAVAPDAHGGSIDHASAKEFAMDEPLINLAQAFRDSEYIEQLIVCFNKCHTCAKQYD